MAKKTIETSKQDIVKARARKAGLVLAIVAVFLAGVVATVSYNSVIAHIEANGVSKYKKTQCEKYAKDGVQWLECDVQK